MTIKEMLANSAARYANQVALRFKRNGAWTTMTYRRLQERAATAAEFMATQMGIIAGDKVAIFRENAPEWPEIYFAITGLGAIAVPIDAKLQTQEVAHILRDSESKAVFASIRSYPLLKELENGLAGLHHVILTDGETTTGMTTATTRYWEYEPNLQELESVARTNNAAYNRSKPKDNDVASFIYTSGTTGRSKGAMLTHHNFTSNVSSLARAIEIRSDDNFLMVLPLHHAFAFTTCLLVPIGTGCQISMVESIRTVGENIKETSPTLIIAVPLLIEKMFHKIWSGLQAKKLAWILFRLGLRKPVITGIRKQLGGKVRLFISGGAPIDPDILRGMNRIGFEILEGYGLTETAPVITLNPQSRPKPGSVGIPLPDVEITILDPNEEGVGEIAAKGPNIMKGYYNNAEATASVFRDDWFRTGDLGRKDKDGYIIITGRKKSMIVNREGKNIYPEEVEQQILKSPYIAETLVLGFKEDGKVGEHVGAIVVPNQDAINQLSTKKGQPFSEKEIEELVREGIKQLCQEIAEYKRPRKIQVRWEEFEKTSTGKVKRYLYAMS